MVVANLEEGGGWSWVLIPPELNYKTQTAQKPVKIGLVAMLVIFRYQLFLINLYFHTLFVIF